MDIDKIDKIIEEKMNRLQKCFSDKSFLTYLGFIITMGIFILWFIFDTQINIFNFLNALLNALPKLLWSFGWAFFGMWIRALLKMGELRIEKKEKEEKGRFIIRYWIYVISLIFVCLLMVCTLYIKGIFQQHIFYPLSASICFLIGFYVFMLEPILMNLARLN
jgi:uncharacterized membrane protein